MSKRLIDRRGLREKGIRQCASTTWRQVRNGELPRPVKFGGRNYWVEEEIDALIEARLAQRDVQKGEEEA